MHLLFVAPVNVDNFEIVWKCV